MRHGVQVWDWARGEPLTPPYRRESILMQAEFSLDGSMLAVVNHRGVLEWLPVPPATRVPMAELLHQVQRITGYGLSGSGEFHRLSAAEWTRRTQLAVAAAP
jgi:hypothetical protein